MQTCADVVRGGAIALEWVSAPVELGRPEVRSEIAEIRAGCRYVEDSFTLVLPSTNGIVDRSRAVASKFPESVWLSRHLPGFRRVAVVVNVRCRDGFVVTRRADWVANPGLVAPVCESADYGDAAAGVLEFTRVAERGLFEELGLTDAQVSFGQQVVTPGSVVGVCYAVVDMPFVDVVASWEGASHRDEGEPLLVDLLAAGRAFSEVFSPKS